MAIDISFITVTMNSASLVNALFTSFYDNMPRGITYEYIVVDNCSSDGTVEFIETYFPEIVVIRNKDFKGFAENNNIGITIANGKIVALINPDIVFLPGAIESTMHLFAKDANLGLVGPMLLNKDGSVQNSARRFLTIKTAALRLLTFGRDTIKIKTIKNYLEPYDTNCEYQFVDWVIGAAMWVRKEAIQDAGLLDTNFFLYIEDQDWCFQMWKRNWKVAYYTKAKLIHDHQRSSARRISKKTLWHVQSILYFLKKNRVLNSKGVNVSMV